MKKAIVNGAAGFAGYSLTIHLLQHGYDVSAIVRPDSPHNERFNDFLSNVNFHLVPCSGEEILSLAEKLDGTFDLFYHLVWFGARNDNDAQFQNIPMTLDALKLASELSCSRFICTGSQAEYGPISPVITEDTPTNPVNAYGAAKLAALYLSKSLASNLGIDWIWGRIFSLYGLYEPSGRLYPDMIEKFKNNEPLNLSDCTQNWEYLDVEDAAEALIALGEGGRSGEIYNISSGEPKPLKEFVEQLKAELNSASEVNYGDRANPYVSLQTDTRKITSDTGWKPQIPFHTI